MYGCDCVRFHLSPNLFDLCSYANFRASYFILLVQFYVHTQRPCLRVHRETTGVLKGVVECQRGTSNTLRSPQCGFFGLELLYLGMAIARDRDLFEGAIFYYFLLETVQDRPRSCRTW